MFNVSEKIGCTVTIDYVCAESNFNAGLLINDIKELMRKHGVLEDEACLNVSMEATTISDDSRVRYKNYYRR